MPICIQYPHHPYSAVHADTREAVEELIQLRGATRADNTVKAYRIWEDRWNKWCDERAFDIT